MRYAQIRSLDISNGEGIGVSLFVQGCNFHCYNCFNSETWDFSGGKEWTPQVREHFLALIDKPYIKRVSILGGEPLAKENAHGVFDIVKRIRQFYGNDKKLWLYSGHTWETIMNYNQSCVEKIEEIYSIRKNIISLCDIMIDGRFIDSQKNSTLKWRGSQNQRVIDIQNSIKKSTVVLYEK